jgi:uncharacterized protein
MYKGGTMGALIEQVKETLQNVKPAYVATASESGKPNVSAKGSVRIIDDDTIAFADVASPRTVANLRENDNISLIVPGNDSQKGCRIWGIGRVVNEGRIFDEFVSDFSAKNMTVNNVIVISVSEVEA